jgi:hypothetical protein
LPSSYSVAITGYVWIKKHILTKKDQEKLDFFTKAA